MPELAPHTPALVCFDLGRVLIRIADNWRDACQAAGVAPPPQLDEPTTLAQLHEIMEQAGVGNLDAEDTFRRIATITPFSPDEVRLISANWLRGPFPGTGELLVEVSATNLHTACLSNTNDHHWQLILTRSDPNYLPLEQLDYRFASHLVGHAKPNPEIYACVEQITGIDPRAIIFFDDTPEHCQAARARGWQAQLIERNSNPIAQMCNHLRTAGVL